ncbi:MAG: glutathione reductase (NADPH), partial [Verrucomicrobiales bacterium]
AYYAITTLNKAGQKVAVIDERPYGGTCALRGCQSKKYLVANATAVAMVGHLQGIGLTMSSRTDWAALQKHKNAFLEGIPEGEIEEFNEVGIATFHCKAQLVAQDEVAVGEERLKAKHIIIATGAVPRRSDIPGAEHLRDSEYFLNMPTLPERILFIGGGYIAFEFAHVAAHAGASVTILNRSARPLKQFDPDTVDTVLEATKASGIEFVINETPGHVTQTASGYQLHSKSGKVYDTDLIVEATGRVPNVSVLDGDHGKVDHSSLGVSVNEFLQSTSNPHVYAIGDCAASGSMLAPLADEEGKVAAFNILNDVLKPVDYSVVPSAVFTIPSLAAVGLTEAQASEQGLAFRINQGTTTGWPSSKRIGEKHASYKVIVNKADDTIIGAHMARHNASEVINIFALAIKHGIKAPELAEFMWAYPTYTSDLKYMVK